MNIAVLSGKGGTGKTFISTNLSVLIDDCVYVDCDVEEPNGTLFLKPTIDKDLDVCVKIPEFDKEKCNGCKECVDKCEFNALAFINSLPILFKEVCHSCGLCNIICKENAIKEIDRKIGQIHIGKCNNNLGFLSGTMNIGEASGVPIIKSILDNIPKEKNIIVDCPPGSSCTVMESIQKADCCILVAEPTEFGKCNLEMVYELTKMFKKQVGVILNKCIDEYNPSEEFCIKNNIEILGKIPYDSEIGKVNAIGDICVLKSHVAKKAFDEILLNLKKKVEE